ncbi:protein of unknown function DUF45 [Desulfofarcimen acetoxidans DSM 771]|jgi:predicted metal-dependent hydrolase|uniref:YgjP-like metallopeptidase domain-containing protein n=1 Tax=Desulfofarcimen acetoxidans (strain ATCC 49208 / DSM 771 / KCTC 5769 / VKM B-1644 / 5575) TaxID=485916 RepID=C8VVC6_DESAS|nr:SprT family zinc-dependent metalloprotease [Desulfofarcimen acetoxidans]ACV61000.1 protein of unknown function DUF45 [Desulfofarcimen acetoxidans DSM 771]
MENFSAQTDSDQNSAIQEYSVMLAGRKLEFILRVSSRAKYLRLQVSAKNGLLVTIPKGYKLKYLEEFIREKRDWIFEKLDKFAQELENSKICEQNKCRHILFAGKEYELTTRVEMREKPDVLLENGRMIVLIPEEDSQFFKVGNYLREWLFLQARLLINSRVKLLSNKLNLTYKNVFIKDQKTRWGSCSQQKNLNFNWRLVMAPLEVLDYVVIHELMHLLELNHSKKFWYLVKSVCPDCRAHREWLRNNGKFLMCEFGSIKF